MTIEEARKDGKLVKVPIPKKVTSHGADLSPWIEQTASVKALRKQSAEIERKKK